MFCRKPVVWMHKHYLAKFLMLLAITLSSVVFRSAVASPLLDGLSRLGSCGNVIFPVPILKSNNNELSATWLIDCSSSSSGDSTPLTNGIMGLEVDGSLFALPQILYSSTPLTNGLSRLEVGGQLFNVPTLLASSSGILLSGNYWFQIQIASNHQEVFQGLGNRFVALPNGTYDVINLTNGQRRDDVVLD